MTERRKLIEVSLPLDEINAESAREKSIRHGHPSTLHLWWARRPLAAARAVLFAQLVDDPSSHPDRFPTEEDQRTERERLHDIIRRLVVWENIGDDRLMREAHAEIVASAPNGAPPTILDPFAGGGTIPLEAQRLGLEAHASDLNPVAVLINKALIEIPPKFAGRPPIHPDVQEEVANHWPRATGLAEDVRRYGQWMRDEAERRIGHLHPKATLDDGSEADVIAWIWARTVTCPNPACGIEMPLVRSWWLGKKKGKEAYVVPSVVPDADAPSGRKVAFSIGHDPAHAPTTATDGTMSGRKGGSCIACGSAAPMEHIKAEGIAGRLSSTLMATVASGPRRRIYVAPSDAYVRSADVERPADVPVGKLPNNPRSFWTVAYGLDSFADLFTNRQLVALTTFSDLVGEAHELILRDALASGLPEGERLDSGGTGAAAYADSVTTYLGLATSRITDLNNSIVTWSNGRDQARNLFARQTIPMAWDFVEVSPFADAAGDISIATQSMSRALGNLAPVAPSMVNQQDARLAELNDKVISTDPPYYDNIGYSDLSDFFYVWLRRSLRDVHPNLFSTMLVPKTEELVANSYRHGGKDRAAEFFESGFEKVFSRARESGRHDYPITVYYAFKQSELAAEGVANTGWATILEGMIRAGWSITATWPVRSERGGRMIAVGTNALASSVVLVLRPREVTALSTNRRGFLSALRTELPEALATMQKTTIAFVDFAQAVIGPGMAVFSRYSEVVEADGSRMSVRTALALINQALDEVLAEYDGDLDPDTRFCLAWFGENGWRRGRYGEAEGLARRFNVAVEGIAHGGVLTAREGWVALTRPTELPTIWNPATDDRISHWEVTLHLARALDSEGARHAARLLAAVRTRSEIDLDAVNQLALRLYRLAENVSPDEAGLFNVLGSEWSNLVELSAALPTAGNQDSLNLDDLT